MNDYQASLASFPSPFARALQKDHYTKGNSQFSVTQLLSPPQRTFLRMNHEEIKTPYGGMMALLGTAIHNILEANVDESLGERKEVRLHTEILGCKVSGQLDFYEPGAVHDYKCVGGVQEAAKKEHYLQVQMNGYLAKVNGWHVQNVGVMYFQRDWKQLQSLNNPAYPKTPFKSFVHPYEEQEAIDIFHQTVSDHLAATQGKPRPCTQEEKWQKPDTYAIMKVGGSRASKVCDSLAEAESLKKAGQYIQTRRAESTYCEHFCGFKHACPQYKREQLDSNPS
jgi:hypothetical protein